jgi:hypothetical protein
MAVTDYLSPNFKYDDEPLADDRLALDKVELQTRIRLGAPIGEVALESIRKGEPVVHWPVYEFADTKWSKSRTHLRLVEDPGVEEAQPAEIPQAKSGADRVPQITTEELLLNMSAASSLRDREILDGFMSGVAVAAINNWVEPGPKRF